jgi:hypothetical protein
MSDSGIIQIMCPKLTCRRILAVPARARGKLVRCRGCGSTIRVPQTRQAAPVVQASTDQSGNAPAGKGGTAEPGAV